MITQRHNPAYRPTQFLFHSDSSYTIYPGSILNMGPFSFSVFFQTEEDPFERTPAAQTL